MDTFIRKHPAFAVWSLSWRGENSDKEEEERSNERVFMVSGENVHLCLLKKKREKRKHLQDFPKGLEVHYCVTYQSKKIFMWTGFLS